MGINAQQHIFVGSSRILRNNDRSGEHTVYNASRHLGKLVAVEVDLALNVLAIDSLSDCSKQLFLVIERHRCITVEGVVKVTLGIGHVSRYLKLPERSDHSNIIGIIHVGTIHLHEFEA